MMLHGYPLPLVRLGLASDCPGGGRWGLIGYFGLVGGFGGPIV
jgi:hypothetical protein